MSASTEKRATAKASKARLLVLGCVFLLLGGRWIWYRAAHGERFQLTSVEIVGASRLTYTQLLERSGLRIGDSLLSMDIVEVVERLRADPWVRAAEAQRVFPNRVQIQVEEHEPVALVALGALYYLDARGRAFRGHIAGEPLDLPIIMGIDRAGYEQGVAVTVARLETAMSFLKAYKDHFGPDEGLPASVEAGAGQLVRYFDSSGVEVVVGPPPWAEALSEAERALSKVRRDEVAVVYVGRKRRAGRVTVRTRAEASEGRFAGDGGGLE